ncbi:MAG: hypothetical protein ABIT83_08695, partial [Massilia sp.]
MLSPPPLLVSARCRLYRAQHNDQENSATRNTARPRNSAGSALSNCYRLPLSGAAHPRSASMNKHMAVKLNHATYRAVLNMLSANGDARSVADVADEAARDWLADMARTSPAAAVEAARGYQWKSLFLPDGTLLRAQYHGEFYYAQVRGDHIEYHGRQYSPRQFVMHLMGSVRNAWRELWILSPGDALWHLADTRRRILRRDFAAPANAMPAALPFPDERKDLRANRKIGAPEDDSAALFQIPWIKALYDVDGAFIGPVDAFVSEDYDDPMELAEWAVTRTADMPDTGVGIASDKLQLIDCAAAPDSAPAAAPPAPSIASVTASACAPATCSPAAQVSAVASPGATGPDSASAHRSPAPPAPTVATTVAMGPESASVNRLPAGRAAAAATPAAMEPGAPSATCSP